MNKREWKILDSCGLFSGIDQPGLERLLVCLEAETAHYEKNAILFRAGQPVHACALVLSGALRAEAVNAAGEHTLMAWHGPGALVGDVLMSTPGSVSPVYVIAAEAATVLFLPFSQMMGGCPECCPSHQRLRENLIGEIAQKYWAQRRRLGYLSVNSLRGRIAMYLLDRSGGEATFSLGLSRENMADYLCVNRSALSRELARMKQEGLIDYYRDTFRLLDLDALARWGQ